MAFNNMVYLQESKADNQSRHNALLSERAVLSFRNIIQIIHQWWNQVCLLRLHCATTMH